MKQMKMNYKQLGLHILVTIIIVWVGITFIPTSHTFDNDLRDRKIDSLTTAINVNNNKQLTQDTVIQNLRDSVKYVDIQLNDNKNKLYKLKKDYEEKIGNIGKYSSNELAEFFTNRYK
jgi:hypothetical protein